MKKPTKTLTDQQKTERLRKKAVAIAKEIAKKRDNYKCQYCGIGKPQRQVHSHHIFHEGMYKSMSADPDNLITLCATHHQGGFRMSTGIMTAHGGFNFHNCPRESTEWFMEHYPERYAELKKRSLEYVKTDFIYWTKKLEKLKQYE